MRVVVNAFGTSPMDALEHHVVLQDSTRPAPAGGEVVVRVRSAAVGWVDLLMMAGQYQHVGQPPYTPGLEYAGEVAAVGPDVTRWSVGDRVIADGFKTGPRSAGPHRTWGGFSTWAMASADALIPLPARLSFDQGANLLGNFETAWHCLVTRGGLREGETVLIHGASGSTGMAAVQLARHRGATVIATGRSPDKLAQVQAAGAHHVVSSVGRFRDAVRALAPGGVDVVYDGVGGAVSAESMRCMAFGGRFLVVGWASTPDVARVGSNQLPTNLIMMKSLDVLGCPTVISSVKDPSSRPPRLTAVLDAVEAGMTPHVGPAYALDDFAEALRAKWESQHVGGCVLHP
ncbi:MAG: NADPH:quinone oxidoreductase family protein [Proteobacteria bacterium]|nr:NADPH:quinone oxidoreductase family protein [Pseudomonadota bacterium]MCP4916950.1 NADPH:quinone oxidoreductase family protein [Pseudomonadota bacterium]